MSKNKSVSSSTSALSQMTVKEVMQEAGICRDRAYALIKKLNGELEAMGKITFRGRVNRNYFEERVGYHSNEQNN